MLPTQNGALRIFRFSGIQVYLHWSWFVVALFEINYRRGHYSLPVWNAVEYLSLFLIVLLHEFGHSLACRQTGGRADTIVLWPLGGVAYVAPPPRPGATLWSIAAGPLVNVILLPITLGLAMVASHLGWVEPETDLYRFLWTITYINGALLCFNLLPVYPLDGGQILRALLWFPLGRARSLMVATVIGLVGVVALGGFALHLRSFWIGLIAVFMLTHCWRSFQQARLLREVELAPTHPGYACPECHAAPLAGAFWICQRCRRPFDPFASRGTCPSCLEQFPVATCPQCGTARPIPDWVQPPPFPPLRQR